MAKVPPTAFGQTLRKIRKSKGLTLLDVSKAIGVTLAAVQKFESSPKSNPQLDTLQKLSGALGVSVAELVRDVPVIPPAEPPAVN